VSDAYFRWAYHHADEATCACDCQARVAAYAAGVEEGQSMDMYATATWDLTHLATLLNDRETLEVLKRLARFLDWAQAQLDVAIDRNVQREVEQGSPLWPTPESEDQEQLPF